MSQRFEGAVTIDPPLNPTEIAYLTRFAQTRRMDRTNGPYYVNGSGLFGSAREPDIRNYNQPPEGQPSLWCQWLPTLDGTAIIWDGEEKFYDPVEWMQYLIDHFLRPDAHAATSDEFAAFTFNHTLNGIIHIQCADSDQWRIVVTNNTVTRLDPIITWPTPDGVKTHNLPPMLAGTPAPPHPEGAPDDRPVDARHLTP